LREIHPLMDNYNTIRAPMQAINKRLGRRISQRPPHRKTGDGFGLAFGMGGEREWKRDGKPVPYKGEFEGEGEQIPRLRSE
jgi:hypothetical protein